VQQRHRTGPGLPRQRAAIPALFEVEVVLRVGNANPTDESGLYSLASAVGEIKIADAFGRQQPLVTPAGGDVDTLGLDIRRHDAERLNRVHDEQRIVTTRNSGESFEVGAKTRGILNVTDGHDTRVIVNQAFEL